MLARVARALPTLQRAAVATRPVFRAFSAKVEEFDKEPMLDTELAGLAGKARAEELAKEVAGDDFDLYDRDAVAYFEEGTKENPIVILSTEESRVVGMSLEDDAFVRFFHLTEGTIWRDPVYNNHFVMKKVNDADVDAALKEAEQQL